ncbi:hypothetical protein AC249_AIPGENE22707 [Exaiptasia diaphana]|nr:hypothetical protein AC249_AIPGENE22707 [Exaiptasia diaphana]
MYDPGKCFVGKRHLEEAVKTVKDAVFEVNWKPFFLNPTLPDGTKIPLVQYITEKYGAAAGESIKSGKGGLSKAGQAVGITFTSGRYVVNSLKSHCLLDYAATVDKQNEVAESLFHRYFENAEDINSMATLEDVAKDSGLNLESAMKHVGDPAIANKIKEEAEGARIQGVSGVPSFEVYLKGENVGTYPSFSGAQPPATFVSIFQRLLKNAKM